jgi:hypothetical protein
VAGEETMIRRVDPEDTVEGLGDLLAVAAQLGALFETAKPGTEMIALCCARLFCNALRGVDSRIDDLVNKIDLLAPIFFSARHQNGPRSELEALRWEITGDLVYHVRVRLALLEANEARQENQDTD